MNRLSRLPMCWLLLGCFAAPAAAQAVTSPGVEERVRETVRALAFDPARFFRGERGRDPSMIRIAYTGFHHATPVYSIALSEGCLEGETRSRECMSRLTARMVRARGRGGPPLARQLIERGAVSDSAIRSRLRSLGVEWLEADARACPGISSLLARSTQLNWVSEQISSPAPAEPVLHGDRVEVVFDEGFRRATYAGYVADASPAAWAVELADALEPCWRPARVAPPWDG